MRRLAILLSIIVMTVSCGNPGELASVEGDILEDTVVGYKYYGRQSSAETKAGFDSIGEEYQRFVKQNDNDVIYTKNYSGEKANVLRQYAYDRGIQEARHGDQNRAGVDGTNGADGSDGADGSEGVAGGIGPQGLSGQDGNDGIDGVDGQDGNAGQDGTSGSDGHDGEDGIDGEQGEQGDRGRRGRRGRQGNQGNRGAAGEDGEDGEDASIVLIDPCGTERHDGNDEILFRLDGDRIVSWYKNRGLVELTPGSYRTTDGTHCRFIVTQNGDVLDDNN